MEKNRTAAKQAIELAITKHSHEHTPKSSRFLVQTLLQTIDETDGSDKKLFLESLYIFNLMFSTIEETINIKFKSVIVE